MAIGIRALWEPLRTIAFGAISGNFAKIGTPLAHPARQVMIKNSTDVPVYISFNGIDIHQEYLAGETFVNDITSNKGVPMGLFQAKGDQIWVKDQGVGAATGKVSVAVMYAKED